MKTLVVPTDFSPAATNAMNYAADMALAINASIVLVNVYQVPVIYGDGAAAAPAMQTISPEELQHSSEQQLQSVKADLARVTAGKVKLYTESRFGDIVEELEKLCAAIDPFAIVMGSQGQTEFERLLMGSTTLKTIRRIKYPVIAVPPGTSYKQIKKVGLACDFKNIIESTPVDFIKNIIREFGAELHVLNIDHNNAHHNNEIIVETAWLESLLGSIKPNYYFLDREDVVEGINEFAETGNLDVVIVIPKKHTFLEGIFHKSKSKELISHAHIPIVSIHE